ncbi:primosomal protein N' [Cytobacillus sp. IB215665]|uniref:primosomal protein N' n=1 Tax=Cytobacillus sp. IB215665 TaxID=3097357 RepID=UPI002A0FD248|nr:primosomal protein N' [Cytobacillus sp. IB215665]MDX8365012.1 primosomal protein N' [Cytobacillus sp. IB215665]
MKIASVIVDVPAHQTDKTFDYEIPAKWTVIIQAGMRVIVPFGSRKVQGFVVKIKNHSDFDKLKPIHTILDVTPVLNNELLNLGSWLSNYALCYTISAYQAMLPAALRAKYDKEIKLSPSASFEDLPKQLQQLFSSKQTVLWKELEQSDMLYEIQNEVRQGNLEVIYQVKDRAKMKKNKVISLGIPIDEIDHIVESLPKRAGKQKEILSYFREHSSEISKKELAQMFGNTSAIKSLLDKSFLTEREKEVYRNPFEGRLFERTHPLPLTNEQQEVISPILSEIEKEIHRVFLMYGVTGSGKTEVYLQSIDAVLKKGKEAIVLVPEISLTPQMVKRFKGRFGSKVAVMHSGLSTGEKYDEWRKIQRNEVSVVVGARSAIFAPFENVGIIIIDEEHETSYKQEENPRYHARDVAIYRGEYHNCPVVLGSATPTLESFARAKKDVYKLLTLSKRMNEQPLPTVDIVDMREELRSGNRSMFSTLLFERLMNRIEKGEQAVLLLNKRGYSSFVMCRDCGFVIQCPHCDISLTYHRTEHQLKCHYCGYEQQAVNECPECQSDHIRFFGTGTQKVEEELTKVIPNARVIRMDVDTTSRKGAHERLLNDFGEGKADILLGTQMIAKGLDFPNVTLVGVLTADTILHIPDFRSSEKTFQLLTQVSGRAGRHELPGEVVIQTYTPEHYSIQLASEHNYDIFYQKEMVLRKLHQYPPFYYLALITVSHAQLLKVVDITEKITAYLRQQLSDRTIIYGPVASPVARVNNRYRYQCMVKYKNEPKLRLALKKIVDKYQAEILRNNLSVAIDLNPHILM